MPVVEQCGAMPGWEDKEGEVSELALDTVSFFQFIETDSFAQSCTSWTPRHYSVSAS
jgi:hypothetical protein